MIVPKSLKTSSLYIWKKYTLYDLLYLLVILILAFLITHFLNINKIVKLVLSFLLFMSFAPLVLESKKHHCKYYVLFWFIVSYWLTQRKYWAHSKKNNTNLLNPYLITKEKLLAAKSKNGTLAYLKIVKIYGFDLSSLEENLQEQKINKLEAFLQTIDMPFSIIKLKEELSYQDNLLKTQNQYLVDNLTYRQIVQSYQATLNDKKAKHTKKISCYLAFQNFSAQDLQNSLETLINQGQKINLKIEKISLAKESEIIAKVNYFKNEASLLSENYSLKENNRLLKLYLQTKKTFYKAQYLETDEQLINLQTLHEFPFEVQKGWAKLLFDLESDQIWHFSDLSTEDAYKNIDKAISTQELNQQTIKNKVAKENENIKLETLKLLATKVAFGNYKIKQAAIMIINGATHLKTLKKIVAENKKKLLPTGIVLNNQAFKQQLIHRQLFLSSQSYQRLPLSIPIDTLAGAWPFYNSQFNDGNLCYLGTNHLNEAIIFDLFKKDQHRKNSNALILGTSGSGKTTFAKKLLLHEIMKKRKIIILDPENEYTQFIKKLGGKTLNLKISALSQINPLKILNFNKANKEALIKAHLNWLQSWLATLYQNFEYQLIIELILILKDLYEAIDYEKTFSWPKMQDLLKAALPLKKQYNLFFRQLEADFSATKKEPKLIENFDFKAPIVSINLKTIMESSEENVLIAYIQMILYFLQELINENLVAQKRLIIFMDEAHIFLNSEYPKALMFLFQWMKRIRKYNGSLILATQNPSDFRLQGASERLASALVNNVQYNFFLNLKDADIEAVNKLYKASGGLTRKEQFFLSNAIRGEILFGIKNNERKFLTLHYNEIEKQFCL